MNQTSLTLLIVNNLSKNYKNGLSIHDYYDKIYTCDMLYKIFLAL